MESGGIDWDVFKQQVEQAARGTFLEELGCTLVEVNESGVLASLQVGRKHLNHLGIIHGGVHATLLDSFMGLAAMAVRPQDRLVTTNLNIHFVSAFKEGRIWIAAETIHQTLNMVTTMGKITNDAGELAAFATGSFRVKPLNR